MAASQRVRSRVPAPQRSILPSVSGIPAGAAIAIAVACTFLGFLIDAKGDGGELTGTFAALYVAGCVAAVLAVRYRGIFTAMVLPPLLLFIAVPLAYQQLTGRSSTGMKDILLNLAIPLVNRFPTMMLATALVLAIGGLRIYLYRRAQDEERAGEARRGTSWGRDASPDRVRTKPKSPKSPDAPMKRRPRRPKPEPAVDISEQKTDKYEPPRPGSRRPSDEVADKPPRVAPKGRPREVRAGGARGGRPAAAAPRAEGEPTRGARQRGEVPPHPRPNVRYRERDQQRRKPEKR